MRTLLRTARLLLANLRPLVCFELAFRLSCAALLGPALRLLLDLAMHLTGFTFLSWENVSSFALQPVVVAGAALVLLLLCALTVFEVSVVLVMLESSRAGERVSVRAAMGYALPRALCCLLPRNALLPLYALLLVPLLNLSLSSGVVRYVALPEFVEEFVSTSLLLSAAAVVIGVLAGALLMRWIFVFHAFVLEGRSFTSSVARSQELTRRHLIADLVSIALLQLGLMVLAGLAVLSLLLLVLLAERILPLDGPLLSFALVFLALPALAVASLSVCLSGAAGFACVSVRWWRRLEERGELAPAVGLPQEGSRHGRDRCRGAARVLALLGVWLLLAGVGTAAIGSVDEGGLPWERGSHVQPQVQVSAHRGSPRDFPENTLPAFQAAFERGADWIELDVQQSADGVLFVSHDSRLRRISGVDKCAWELTMDEIRQLDAGSHLSPEFAGVRYPLLSEVLAWAKERGVRLNIELKPTGHERRLEETTAALLRESGYERGCMVTSMSYSTLLRMRDLAPEIPRAYVMTLAYGDVCQLDAADCFSIEGTSATRPFVRYLHQHGKEVLVWTANSPETVSRAISNGADNIITDDVEMARAAMEAYAGEPASLRWLHWVLGALV
ncbi:glycerophosphodiester phosphodiesterase family protein [Olsenella urininfantis]|uniref:glycerophosphodiester phosphodiesterase family protein n=1 Tax=Olsenella urininfantis TaxID=1871033 RepID=UPI000985953B|nr:glycerophosphodiester phosphodiesterase family protein [Olsenella urininfantis]